MDDIISRQAAIDALMSWVEEHKDNAFGGCLFHWTGIKALLENLPSAEPKRGKWVLVCDNNGMHFICNKCGAWRYHQEQKFCGECGADMRQKGENSESN